MENLAAHIKLIGITQSAFAARVGMSKSYMSEILSGRRTPSREMIQRIDQATDGRVPPAVWFQTSGDAA